MKSTIIKPGRREFLKYGAAGTAAAVAWFIGATEARAARKASKKEIKNDIDVANLALAAEHQAIFAYDLAVKSGLLSAAVKDVGVMFQQSHAGHLAALTGAIRNLGGAPVDALASYTFSDPLKTEEDVVKLAYRLEVEAAQAYLAAIPQLVDPDYVSTAAKILGDEVTHAVFLRGALKKPPAAGMNDLAG